MDIRDVTPRDLVVCTRGHEGAELREGEINLAGDLEKHKRGLGGTRKAVRASVTPSNGLRCPSEGC